MRTQFRCWKRLEGRILVAGMAVLLAPLAARAQTSCTVNATTDTGAGSGSSGDILYCQNLVTFARSNFTINFDQSLNGQTITLSQSVSLFNAFGMAITVQGPGANLLTISGGGSSTVGSIFLVSGTVTISGLTIADGSADFSHCVGYGGAICNGGSLTVINCTFSGNTAQEGGGGIANNAGNSLTVLNSTFSGNTAQNGGGGIFNNGSLAVTNSTFSGNTAQNSAGGGIFSQSGSVTVTNSAFFGNTAQGEGGGLYASGSVTVANSTFFGNTAQNIGGGGIFNTGSLTVTNSTLSGNTAQNSGGGGIINFSGSVMVTNSIVAGNITTKNPGDDCDGCGAQSSYNLISTPGNVINLQLSPLGNYGGPTQTMLPLPGSPAICLGSPALAGGLTTDQRGFPRLNTTYAGYSASQPCVDAGAVQTNYQSVTFTNAGNSGYSGIGNAAVNTPAAPNVSVTENGQNIGGVPVTLSFSGNGTATGLGPVTTVAGTGATFPAVTVNAAGASDTLSATLNITPSNSFPFVSITSGPIALNIISPVTTTIVSASPSSPTYGQAVTLLAAVSSSFAAPTGSVSFSVDGGTSVAGSASACSGSPANTSCFVYITSSLNAGTHTVMATYVPTGSFQGSSGNTMVTVSKATATVTLGNLAVTYNGSPQSPTVTTTPSGLSTTLSGAPETNPGNYPVTATINNPNYTGSASGSFVINFTASAPPSSNACNGAYNGKFAGDLTVSAGQNCFLAGGATGNVTQTGGQLILSGALVGGNVQIQGGSFWFGPATTIQGNLQIQGLPASTTQNAVCGVTVNGLLEYQNSAAPVEIGGATPASCPGNTVRGNLLVQNNSAAVTVFGNMVNGNLQLLANNAPVIASTNTVGNNMLVQNNTVSSQIFNDVVTDNLQCSGNTLITGGGDKAGQRQGQCASF